MSHHRTDIENGTTKIVVSDEFFEIFLNMNVICQIQNLEKLSKKEIYVMLNCIIDHHDIDDKYVFETIQHFQKEMTLLHKYYYQESEHIDEENNFPEELSELISECGNNLIDFMVITTDGKPLPKPYPKWKAIQIRRNILIDEIL